MDKTLSPEKPAPRLLDQVRHAIRLRHYSIRTERAYVYWISRFIRFNSMRHPRNLGAVIQFDGSDEGAGVNLRAPNAKNVYFGVLKSTIKSANISANKHIGVRHGPPDSV